MPEFKIEEVQIDNYNDTNNSLTRFKGGLNVICGVNEAGKTTLMSFIKNVFLSKKTDAKGYMKCLIDKQSVNLTANKNKLKENEQFLKMITPYRYKTGFIIELDDLTAAKKSDTDELIDMIKDSAGRGINKKQEDYEEFIFGKKQPLALTGTNKASKTFIEMFNNLKNTETLISELEKRENEYESVRIELENIEKEIKNKAEQLSCMEIILERQKVQSESDSVSINQKLIENRAEFEEIREFFGALNRDKSRIAEFETKTEELRKQYKEKCDKLNMIEPFDDVKISNFKINPEDLKYSRQLCETEKEILNSVKSVKENLQAVSDNLKEIQGKKEKLSGKLNSIPLKNPNEYENDISLAENYLKNHSKLLDEYRLSDRQANASYSFAVILIFAALACMSFGGAILFNQLFLRLIFIVLLIASLSGIAVSSMIQAKSSIKNGLTDELARNKSLITKLFKKYGFEFDAENDFTVQADSIVKKMIDYVTEYKVLLKEIRELEDIYEKENEKYNKLKNEENRLESDYKKLSDDKNEFLSRVSVNVLKNYEEIYEYIRELKSFLSEINKLTEQTKSIENDTEIFVQKLNDFLDKSELDKFGKINKYDDFDYIPNEIRDILDKNLENQKLRNELLLKINECTKRLEKYSYATELNEVDEELILKTKEELNLCGEEKGKLIHSKELLEDVSGLIELKNRRNAEINRLKFLLNNLVVKEVVYNAIKAAKEKFNEVQPNLVSAKIYFEKITGGKYSNIDFEKKCISGSKIGDKNWDILSRGTKEQLYLALRLGFARNYSKDRNGNPNGLSDMPLIIDDAFVNFDRERTCAVLECLEEFSKTNQVLFFTCHDKAVKEILNNSKIKHHLISLPNS